MMKKIRGKGEREFFDWEVCRMQQTCLKGEHLMDIELERPWQE